MGKFGACVASPVFEVTFAAIICINAVVMALEAQHEGIRMGSELGIEHYGTVEAETWPYVHSIFTVLEYSFGYGCLQGSHVESYFCLCLRS